MIRVLHLTTHINTGGITSYIHKIAPPLSKCGVETQVLSSGGEWDERFREIGVKTHTLAIRTKSELHPKLYAAIPAILKILRDEKIDLLHAHTRITQVMAFWISKFARIPHVTTCHGFYKRRLGRLLLPAWGDQAIAISQPVADSLHADFRVPIEKIHMINNAVDIEAIDAACLAYAGVDTKKSFGFGPSDPVVGVVARLVADKGHNYLIRAVAELRQEFPNIRLLIVGDGNYREPLETIVKDLGLEKNTVFTGNLTDVIRPLLAMDVFALPATWREGFGLSIVEAMACRKPVIVTNIWSLNSLIQDHATGIMIEPKQVEPLVQAIGELLRNQELRQKISLAGRKMTEDLFGITRMAHDLSALYQSVAGQKGPRLLMSSRA